MAISRVPGYSLLSNLDRQGIDLQFTTNGNALVYMDFSTFRVGINTTALTESLSVGGNILVANGHLYSLGNVTHDLGKTSNFWRNLYVANATVSNNLTIGGVLTIDGNVFTSNITGNIINADEIYEAGYRVLTANSNIIVNGDATGYGMYNNVYITFNNSGVNATSYGSANTIVQLSVNDKGLITSAANLVLTRVGNLYVSDTELYSQTGNIIITSAAGNISVSNSRITNVATPISNSDATTKLYVDATVSAASKAIYSENSSITVYDANTSPGWISTLVDNVEVANVTTLNTYLYNNVHIGSFTVAGNTISATGNIILDPAYPNLVKIYGNAAVQIPSGDDQDRPDDPVEGYIRYSTSRNGIEFWDGAAWQIPGEINIISDIFTPDGVSNVFTLTANTTTQGVLVSINGTVQRPQSAYTVSNNAITFTEVPLITDIIEVRTLATGAALSSDTLGYDNSLIVADGVNLTITGNLIPSANITYSLGSESYQWKDLWVSGNTIYIGGAPVTVANGQLSLGGNIIGAAEPFGNVNVKAYTESMGFANYSNVNVKAYTESMGFKNYSNVNVASYLGGSFSVGTISSGTWNGTAIGIAYGGTGATSTSGIGGALDNLLPSGEQTGYVLSTSGAGSYAWVAPTAGGTTVGQQLTTLRQANTIVGNTTVINLAGISYTPGAGQLRVYVNGVRQFPSAYTETSNVSYTLSANVVAGDVVFSEIDQFSSFNNYANLTYASNIGNIAAAGLTVQSAINSLETNKAPLVSPVFTGDVTTNSKYYGDGSQLTGTYDNNSLATSLAGGGTYANTSNWTTSTIWQGSTLTLYPDMSVDMNLITILNQVATGTRITVVDAVEGTFTTTLTAKPTNPGSTWVIPVQESAPTDRTNITSISFSSYSGNIATSGLVTLTKTTEVLDTKSSVTGTVVHNFSTSAIWYYSNIAGNVTANITNVPTTDNRITSVSIVVNQGATGYLVNGIQINGSAQTIKWQGNTVPTASTNKVDVFAFSLIRAANAWTVLGSATSHG